MKFLRHMVKAHFWFVKASRSYAGGFNPRFPMQWPKAWLRFMWFTTRDYQYFGHIPFPSVP